jgi:hypothetical protein
MHENLSTIFFIDSAVQIHFQRCRVLSYLAIAVKAEIVDTWCL